MLQIFTKLKTEINVGILMIIGAAMLVYSSIRVTQHSPDLKGTYDLVAYFDNVTGLAVSTAVRVAGIQVGEVTQIDLERGRARVTMAIYQKYQMRTDTRAIIKSIGILGDVYIELTMGSPNSEALQHNDVVQLVEPSASLDNLIENLTHILNDVRGVTKALNNSLGGKGGEEQLQRIILNVESLTRRLDDTIGKVNAKTASVMQNLDRFTGDLSSITRDNKDELREMVANLRGFSDGLHQLIEENNARLNAIITNMDRLMAAVAEDGPEITKDLKGILHDNRENLEISLDEIRQASERLNSTMASVDLVARKIENGEGTIGKLLNDEQTVDSLNEALEGINQFINPVNKLRLDVGFQIENLTASNNFKSTVNVNIRPVRDHYYIIKLVSDPNGKQTKKTTLVRDLSSDSIVSNEEEYETTDEFKYTLMIAQRYFDTEFRLGLIENTGGFGIDQYFGRRDQFRLNVDAWDFSRENDLPFHLRVGAFWRFLGNIYLVGGVDDALNEEKDLSGNEYRNPYLGIGLSFNEDNIKSYLGAALGAVGN